jgi:hypothetical protein
MKNLLYIFLATSLLAGCKKEPVIEPCSNTDNGVSLNQDFELVWSEKDSRGFTCYGTVVTPTSVVYFIDPAGPGGDDIIALDKVNGDTIWSKPAQSSTSKHKLIGNTICYSRSGLICIDISTGSEVWRISNTSTKSLNDFIYANNKIYAFFDLGGGITGDSTNLYEIDPVTGNSVEKYTLYGKDRNGYNQSPRGMIFYKHPNGNEIIFTQANGYKPSITSSRGEYYAIDITNDSMYWDLGSYYNLNGIGSTPIINGDILIFNGPWSQHTSINLRTKTINWNTQVPNAYRTGGGYMIELGGKIFQSVGNAAQFNILNASDGSFYKNYSNLGYDSFGSDFVAYNNHIYFTTTKGLFKMNASGTIVKQILATEALADSVGGSFSNGLDIDRSTGHIYTTCGFNMVCIKEK